jgi:uncharacterized membrane protein YphA (DoxX/SURF4 family)
VGLLLGGKMEAAWLYLLARLCTCGLWAATGTYSLFHYKETTVRMSQNNVPWPKYMLVPVLIMKFGGSLMLISNQFVWLAALAWILFLVVASILFHLKFYDQDGNFIFLQMIQLSKNVSMVGGLLCLLLLDPNKPEWLVR